MILNRNEKAVQWCELNLPIGKSIEVKPEIFNALKKIEMDLWILDNINLVFFKEEKIETKINWKVSPIKKSYHVKRIIQ